MAKTRIESRPIMAEVLDAQVEFIRQPFVHPLQISSGVISDATEARVQVRVRVGETEAIGRGSIYLSVLWAWPDSPLSIEERDTCLRKLCVKIASDLRRMTGSSSEGVAHPLVLGMRLHEAVCVGIGPDDEPIDDSVPPVLAQAMALSPFDAAIHDAVGVALGRSAYDLYEEDFELPGVDHWFRQSACTAIRLMFISPPRSKFPAWLIVGKNDILDQNVKPWVVERGYYCMKLKTTGRDVVADVERTHEVYRALKSWGVEQPRITVDCNEACPDTATVLDYLHRLRDKDPQAYDALEYLEQPTGRDITRHAFDWREVTLLKPVLLDEGLYDLGLLEVAEQQGWSGFALKTCKGHSFALICAAWAQERRLMLALQDLTNPGFAAIHAALFAGYVPTVNGVELNSPQFTPAANEPWLPGLSGLLDPQDGLHRLDTGSAIGLGNTLT